MLLDIYSVCTVVLKHVTVWAAVIKEAHFEEKKQCIFCFFIEYKHKSHHKKNPNQPNKNPDKNSNRKAKRKKIINTIMLYSVLSKITLKIRNNIFFWHNTFSLNLILIAILFFRNYLLLILHYVQRALQFYQRHNFHILYFQVQ